MSILNFAKFQEQTGYVVDSSKNLAVSLTMEKAFSFESQFLHDSSNHRFTKYRDFFFIFQERKNLEICFSKYIKGLAKPTQK